MMGQLDDQKLAKPRKTRKLVSDGQRAEWKGYVNVFVTARYREAYEAWESDDNLVFEGFRHVLGEGYKVSFWVDVARSSVVCTLYCNNVASPQGGYAMTARGGKWYSALAKVLFQHLHVCGENWTDAMNSRPLENWEF